MRKLGKASLPIVATVTLVLCTSSASWACVAPPVPEIDPSTGMAAMALVAGAVLIIRSRRKKTSSAAEQNVI
jgi:hypothetical protein